MTQTEVELEEQFQRETGLSRKEMIGLLSMLMTRESFRGASARRLRIWEGSILGKQLKLVETRASFGKDYDYTLEAIEWEIAFTVCETPSSGHWAAGAVPFGKSHCHISCTSFEGLEDQYNTDLTLVRLLDLAGYDPIATDPEFMDPWILKDQDQRNIGACRAIP